MARNVLVVLLLAVALGQGALLASLAGRDADRGTLLVTVAPPTRDVAGALRAAAARVGLEGDVQAHSMSRTYSRLLQRYGVIAGDGSADDVARALLVGLGNGSLLLDAHRKERLLALVRQARAARDEVRNDQSKAARCETEIANLTAGVLPSVHDARPGPPGGVDAWLRLADLLRGSP